MKPVACVYKFSCGDFFYIGSTSNLVRRARDHSWRLNSGKHHAPKLQAAFNAGGKIQFFPVAFVEDSTTPDDLRNKLRTIEQEKLDFCFNDEFCCNQSPNAFGPNNNEAMKNKWEDPEYREKMVNFIQSRKGALVTAETREKMAASKRGSKNAKARAVILKTPNGVTKFDTVTDAAKFLNVPQQVLDGWMMGRFSWPGTGTRPAKPHYTHLANYSAEYA